MLQTLDWPIIGGSLIVATLLAFIMSSWFSSSKKKEGEFDAKSTAKEVCDYYSKHDPKFLAGKTIIITG